MSLTVLGCHFFVRTDLCYISCYITQLYCVECLMYDITGSAFTGTYRSGIYIYSNLKKNSI